MTLENFQMQQGNCGQLFLKRGDHYVCVPGVNLLTGIAGYSKFA